MVGSSIFIDPKQVGLISDFEKHHVSYDKTNAYLYSVPVR